MSDDESIEQKGLSRDPNTNAQCAYLPFSVGLDPVNDAESVKQKGLAATQTQTLRAPAYLVQSVEPLLQCLTMNLLNRKDLAVTQTQTLSALTYLFQSV